MPLNIKDQLVSDFNLQPVQVENTLALFDEGATVPFIARYRKREPDHLMKSRSGIFFINTLITKNWKNVKLPFWKVSALRKLTSELEQKINATLSKTELEDLYLPFKPKKTTRATKAKEAGLEPLARFLIELTDTKVDLLIKASEFLNLEKESILRKRLCRSQ